MTRIKLVEQHIIRVNDPRFAAIDAAAFASKNLYNAANYLVRQAFIHEGVYHNNAAVFHLIKGSPEYQALPRKVSNLVLKQLNQAWTAFFAAIKVWRKQPERFLGRPRLPAYKEKQGRNLLQYDIQAISKPALAKGIVRPSQLGIEITTQQRHVRQLRFVPRKGYYVAEIVYEVDPTPAPNLDSNLVAGIDLGIDNLATITTNKRGFTPLVVNGRPLKSINQYYNKRRAELQSQLGGNRRRSKQIDRLTTKRNRKVKDYLHKASRFIIDTLVGQGIGTIVVGRTANWKQAVNIGSRNNQNFVQIPHAQFWQMIQYKARLVGIEVMLQEESYTSKCSFLDLESIGKQVSYQGKRIKRGLFRASNGRLINADCNGAYNIMRKAVPEAFADGIEGIAVCPVRVTPVQR
ncbi:MAG: transposase [Chloroflexota bacterium]